MVLINSIDDSQRESMLTALKMVRAFEFGASAGPGKPARQEQEEIAAILGIPSDSLASDDFGARMRDAVLGLLHLSRVFVLQIAQDEGGDAMGVLAGAQRIIEQGAGR